MYKRQGLGSPLGTFGNSVDPGFAFDADLERRLAASPNIALQVLFGYNTFGVSGGDLKVTRLSGNLKWYLPVAPAVKLFVNGGAGAYWFDPGDTETGTNVGGGIQWDVTATFAIEGAYNLHVVSGDRDNVKFATYQGGVRIRF